MAFLPYAVSSFPKSVLDKVGAIMKPVLKNIDYEALGSNAQNPRWRNAAQWALNIMVNEGLLKNGSSGGIWEISDKGQRFLAGEID
jgi:hypothetical protein